MCDYGAGCNNPKCIYRHPTAKDPSYYHQSKDPCMAFLAGQCAFDAKGCRKRHPPKQEAEQLIARYKRTKCRFGDDCKTRGCLYQHPSDEPLPAAEAPKLAAWGNPRTSSWRVQPPTVVPPQYQQAPNAQTSPFPQQHRPPPSQNLYPPRRPIPNETEAVSGKPFVPNPSAKAFVPQASAKEFVPKSLKKDGSP